MAEWLRSGLQIRIRRFDSGRGLQKPQRWQNQGPLTPLSLSNHPSDPARTAHPEIDARNARFLSRILPADHQRKSCCCAALRIWVTGNDEYGRDLYGIARYTPLVALELSTEAVLAQWHLAREASVGSKRPVESLAASRPT